MGRSTAAAMASATGNGMRKSNREISVFSLSAMDLFASAMGAFMLICLVALPYYLNAGDQRRQIAELTQSNQAARQRLEQSQSELAGEVRRQQQRQREFEDLQEELQQQQQQMEGMRRDLANAGMVIMAKWDTSADIDLYVVTPKGYEYGAFRHNRLPPGSSGGARPHYPDENAELSLDANGTNPTIPNARGASGIEVWMAVGAGAGEYKVYLQRCNRHEDPDPVSTRVDLTIIHQDKYYYKTIENVMLSGDPNSRPAATSAVVTINAEGEATLR